jgi:hypothetical protein
MRFGGDVDHVDAHQRIGALNRPLLRHRIKPQWGKQVRGISHRSMRRDTLKCMGSKFRRRWPRTMGRLWNFGSGAPPWPVLANEEQAILS